MRNLEKLFAEKLLKIKAVKIVFFLHPAKCFREIFSCIWGAQWVVFFLYKCRQAVGLCRFVLR